jgi:hypothetical protein
MGLSEALHFPIIRFLDCGTDRVEFPIGWSLTDMDAELRTTSRNLIDRILHLRDSL